MSAPLLAWSDRPVDLLRVASCMCTAMVFPVPTTHPGPRSHHDIGRRPRARRAQRGAAAGRDRARLFTAAAPHEGVRESGGSRLSSVDALLDEARAGLERVTPQEADKLRQEGAVLVDIRPHANRAAEGEIPGAVPVERIVLEWRLAPDSEWRLPGVTARHPVL